MREYFKIALLILLLSSCAKGAPGLEGYFVLENGVQTKKFKLELANTPGKRSLGLMYRKEMARDRGMLFIFPEEKERSFWMKNTYLPLDIVFVGSNMKIISIAENVRPLSEASVPSNGPASAAVELNAGTAKELGLKPGCLLVIIGALPQAS